MKDHITKCYTYGKEPHDRNQLDPNMIDDIQYDGPAEKFPWWLHTMEQLHGKNNFIDINWTKKILGLKRQTPRED